MSPSILVVDDNIALAENLTEILCDCGFDAVCVGSPAEALKLVLARSFDVALLDVRMPGMDGVALHGLLRTRMPKTAFILMTAFASDERIGIARKAGVLDVLAKPFSPGALLDMVGRARLAAC